MIKKENLQYYFKHKKTRQVGVLYFSMIFTMLFSVLVSAINTRLLGPELFGDFKFLQRIFSLTVSFLTCGIFISGGRLIAQKKHAAIRPQLTGALLVYLAIISALLIVGLFCFSFFQNDLFNNDLGRYIRIFSPLLFVYPLRLCLVQVLMSDNRIGEIAVKDNVVPLLYAAGALTLNYFTPLSLAWALALDFFSMAVVFTGIVFWIRPDFKNIKNHLRLIWQENRTNGFQVFIGSLAGVASVELAGIAIGYFMENTYVGYYSLAITITRPLTMVPPVVATAFFKNFANSASIPRKVSIITYTLASSALLAYFMVIKQLFFLIYPADYAPVLPLAYYLACTSILHGMGDFYSRFLVAHGRGREQRDSAIIVGIINVAGYCVLVKHFGVMGAVVTQMTASVAFLLMRYGIYRGLANKLRREFPRRDS